MHSNPVFQELSPVQALSQSKQNICGALTMCYTLCRTQTCKVKVKYQVRYGKVGCVQTTTIVRIRRKRIQARGQENPRSWDAKERQRGSHSCGKWGFQGSKGSQQEVEPFPRNVRMPAYLERSFVIRKKWSCQLVEGLGNELFPWSPCYSVLDYRSLEDKKLAISHLPSFSKDVLNCMPGTILDKGLRIDPDLEEFSEWSRNKEGN